jgi:hypothetical protein
MHADLLTFDVQASDGANVGLNPVQTIPPGGKRVYTWQTHRPEDCEQGEACHPGHVPEKGLPLGPLLLQDMADFRNHRHHGLVGALVVLPADATPHKVEPKDVTAAGAAEVWHGARVTVRRTNASLPEDEKEVEHMVLLMQDGLRLYLNGNPGFPLPDPPEEAGEAEKEDQGQKGFNYRSEPIGPDFDPKGSPYTLNGARHTRLAGASLPEGPGAPGRRAGQASALQFHHSRGRLAGASLRAGWCRPSGDGFV